jgi:DNA-binding NtrC family response regulator
MGDQQRLNLLVVDRDEGCIAEVKDFLTGEGYQVQVLTEPEQVVEEVKKGRFQLVLLDVSPAGLGGVALLDQIRAADSDVCVIAMTAVPSVEVAVRALKSQAFDYIQKPLDTDELREVIRASKLTLKQLANRTGLSVSLISQIELGKSAASMSTMHKLSTALQVKMTYFFETV